jgi:hypothetical protein
MADPHVVDGPKRSESMMSNDVCRIFFTKVIFFFDPHLLIIFVCLSFFIDYSTYFLHFPSISLMLSIEVVVYVLHPSLTLSMFLSFSEPILVLFVHFFLINFDLLYVYLRQVSFSPPSLSPSLPRTIIFDFHPSTPRLFCH